MYLPKQLDSLLGVDRTRSMSRLLGIIAVISPI